MLLLCCCSCCHFFLCFRFCLSFCSLLFVWFFCTFICVQKLVCDWNIFGVTDIILNEDESVTNFALSRVVNHFRCVFVCVTFYFAAVISTSTDAKNRATMYTYRLLFLFNFTHLFNLFCLPP